MSPSLKNSGYDKFKELIAHSLSLGGDNKKNGIVFSTVLILGLAGSFYYFIFMDLQKDNIIRKKYEVLERVESNLEVKIHDLQALIQTPAFSTGNSDMKEVRYMPDSGGIFQKEGIWWYKLGSLLPKTKTRTTGQNNTVKGVYYVEIKYLIQSLIPKGVFDGLFIVDSKKVIYSQGNYGRGLKGEIDAKFWSPDRDSTIAYNSKTLSISDTYYHSFPHTQEAAEASKGQWLMVGLVELSNINSAAKSINIWLIVILSLLVLVVVISMPILKTMFINDLEPFNSRDVVLSGMSIIIGVSIFFLAILSVWEYSGFYTGKLENQLESLQEDIDKEFSRELSDMLSQMDNLDTRIYFDRASKPQTGNKKSVTFRAVSSSDDYSFFNEFLWAKDSGQQLGQLTRLKSKELFDLSERGYFKEIKNGKVWSVELDGSKREFVLASNVSWITGKREAVIIKEASGRVDSSRYIAMSTRLNSVLDPAFPKPFEFAIMDKSGAVLFHSNPEKNLNENFLSEVDGDRSVEATLYGSNRSFFQSTYWGKRVKGVIAPMKNVPLFLAVYSPLESPRSHVAGVVSFCLILFTVTILFLGILTYGTFFIQKQKGLDFELKKFGFEWVRNRNTEDYNLAYQKLLYVCVVCGVLIYGYWLTSPFSFEVLLGLSILIPSILFIIVYWDLELGAGRRMIGADQGRVGVVTRYNLALKTIGLIFLCYLTLLALISGSDLGGLIKTFIGFLILMGFLYRFGFLSINSPQAQKLNKNLKIAIFQVLFMALVNLLIIGVLKEPGFVVFEIILFLLAAEISGLRRSVFNGKKIVPDNWFSSPTIILGMLWLTRGRAAKKYYLSFVSTWLLVGHLLPVFINFQTGSDLENVIWNRYQSLSLVYDLKEKTRQLKEEYNDEFNNYNEEFSARFLKNKVGHGDYYESLNYYLIDLNDQQGKSVTSQISGEDRDNSIRKGLSSFLSRIRPKFKTILNNRDGLIYESALDSSIIWHEVRNPHAYVLEYKANEIELQTTTKTGDLYVVSEPAGHRYLQNLGHDGLFIAFALGLIFGYKNLVKRFNKKLFGEEFQNIRREVFRFNSLKRMKAGSGLIYNVLPGSDLIPRILRGYRRLKKSKPDSRMSLTVIPIESLKLPNWPSGPSRSKPATHYVVHDLSQLTEFTSVETFVILQNLEKVLKQGSCVAIVSTIYPKKIFDQLSENWSEEDSKGVLNLKKVWSRVFVMFEELVHSGISIKRIANQNLPDVKVSSDALKVEVVSNLQIRFDGLWSSLTNRQRYLLVDLAEDGFINTKSKLAIVSLIRKGLIYYDNTDESNRFKYTSPEFETYVAFEATQEVGLQLKREMKRRGVWGGISTSIYIMVVVALIFIAVSEPDYFKDFNSFMALIAGVITLLPTLGSLFSVPTDSDTSD